MHYHNDIAKELLKNEQIKDLLKEMILEKETEYLRLSKNHRQFLKTHQYDPGSELTRHLFIERYAYYFRGGQEIKQIEKDLSSMCFHLNKGENKIPDHTQWEEDYTHATCEVRIEDVVSRYLGTQNFKRNLKCPFHEDRTASMKVYTKSNRFVCFGCHVRGSPIDFVMQKENCSFKEAVHLLRNF